MLPSATEDKVCYWCDNCKQFVLPDHLHTGKDRTCLEHGNQLKPEFIPRFKTLEIRVELT